MGYLLHRVTARNGTLGAVLLLVFRAVTRYMNFLEKNVTPRNVSQEAKTERLVEEEMSIRGEVASRRSFILLAHFVHSLGRRLVSPAAKSWSDRETGKGGHKSRGVLFTI